MKKLEIAGKKLLLNIGVRIRSLRNNKNISQEDFAADCGFDRTYISRIELGKRNLTIVNLKRIADGLGIELSKLLTRL